MSFVKGEEREKHSCQFPKLVNSLISLSKLEEPRDAVTRINLRIVCLCWRCWWSVFGCEDFLTSLGSKSVMPACQLVAMWNQVSCNMVFPVSPSIILRKPLGTMG